MMLFYLILLFGPSYSLSWQELGIIVYCASQLALHLRNTSDLKKNTEVQIEHGKELTRLGTKVENIEKHLK